MDKHQSIKVSSSAPLAIGLIALGVILILGLGVVGIKKYNNRQKAKDVEYMKEAIQDILYNSPDVLGTNREKIEEIATDVVKQVGTLNVAEMSEEELKALADALAPMINTSGGMSETEVNNVVNKILEEVRTEQETRSAENNTVIDELSKKIDSLTQKTNNLQKENSNLSSKVESAAKGSVGPQGPQGPAGKDGANGKDGVNGTNGQDGKDAVGTAGKDGRDGKDGVDGKDGKNGVNGTNGTNGRDGVDGQDGKDLYQLAQETGYTGTLEQFISAQNGQSTYIFFATNAAGAGAALTPSADSAYMTAVPADDQGAAQAAVDADPSQFNWVKYRDYTVVEPDANGRTGIVFHN